jgi:hypothetical protein
MVLKLALPTAQSGASAQAPSGTRVLRIPTFPSLREDAAPGDNPSHAAPPLPKPHAVDGRYRGPISAARGSEPRARHFENAGKLGVRVGFCPHSGGSVFAQSGLHCPENAGFPLAFSEAARDR